MSLGPALLARLAARALPSWCRDRYEVEFCAELADLSWTAQWGHAAGLLVAAGPLRIAVLRGASIKAGFRDPTLGCLLGLHHSWRPAFTDDGERYLRCTRCGTDDPHQRPGRGGVVPPLAASPSQ